MPNFNTMNAATAAAIIGVLSVLAFAMSIELGRVGRTSSKRFKGWENPPPRSAIAFAVAGYLIVFAFVTLMLLDVINGGDTRPLLAWIFSGAVFVVDVVIFGLMVVTPRAK